MKKALFLCLLLAACNPGERTYENYGDISTGPGGIALTSPSEHPSGWGRKDCLLCHNISLNVHRNPGSAVDADYIIQQAKALGSSYCLTCHGPNGVE